MNIAEILKRKGIIKRSPEEIARIASRASIKVSQTSPLVASEPFPEIPENLRWKEINLWGVKRAFAWIGSHYAIQIRQNDSGRYRDKHLISIHKFFDDYKGKLLIDPEPIVSRWHECHFTNDRGTLKNLFQH